MRYAIIDIETTGGNPKSEKITEIAIYVHDGQQVVNEFVSLINPECSIPPYITGLTGITNQMVAKAPKFFQVAKHIVELTTDCVFVAHNASFDYGFVKEEFKRLGYDYQRTMLDTVRLSRKLLPGHASYSLGNLCADLGIGINGRHRAAGDAWATVQLFNLLLTKTDIGLLTDPETAKMLKGIENGHHRNIITSLPDVTGVYSLFDSGDKLIYIGKSLSVKMRVAQHLRSTAGQKSTQMAEAVARAEYVETGSELLALLLESAMIKQHQPLYNRKLRRTVFGIGLFAFYDFNGYLNLKAERLNKKSGTPVSTFLNVEEAKLALHRLIEKHHLCQKLCGVYHTDGPCFNHSIKQCNGACIGAESAQIYNARVQKAIETYRFGYQRFFVVDVGRNQQERTVIKVDNGVLQGYAFVEPQNAVLPHLLNATLVPLLSDRDAHQIIKSYLLHNDQVVVVPFPL